jgi:hypothetical protein
MMQKRLILCAAALLAAVVLVILLGALTGPSDAQTSAPLLADRAAASASGSVTPTTYVTTIVPGLPMTMGDTDVILEFAPGASGLVTVTMVPTTPVNPPITGAVPMNWHITTTATSYEVTATFVYSRAARNADVVLVFDESGSMEFDTLCYGCWDKDPFPDGTIYPLKWSRDSATAVPTHCTNDDTYYNYSSSLRRNDFHYQHRTYGDRYYIVIEAEEYSYLREVADYHKWSYTPYKTFWVMQRNGKGSTRRDSRGGYLSHHPFANYENTGVSLGVGCTWSDLNNGEYCRRNWSKSPYGGVPGGPFPAPRADYDFYAPASDDYYIWIRGQGGYDWGTTPHNDYIFWGMNGSVQGQEGSFPQGAAYDGASSGSWDWRCLGSESLSEGDHTLNLWAGGAGFDVDRIVITTNSSNCSGDGDPPDSAGNLPANNARTNWACNRCDPRFAGLPGGLHVDVDPGPGEDWWWLPDCNVGANPDQRDDPIYEGELPIRSTIDAAMGFVSQIDRSRDQIGYVSYESISSIRDELECLQRLGPGGCTADVISTTVISEVYTTVAGGGTNMAGGMMDGIKVLSTGSGHYGRPEATHTMILMTDGEVNVVPNDYCDDDPSLWPPTSWSDSQVDRAKDCVIYYAHEARDQGIIIRTFSLGYQADLDIMQAVADITGGAHWWFPYPDTLPAGFSMILAEPQLLHAPPVDVEAIYRRDTPTSPWTVHPLNLTENNVAAWTITGTDVTALSQWTLGPATPQEPHHIILEADPTSLPADGSSEADITATVVDIYGLPAVPDGTVVTFTTSLGDIDSEFPPHGHTKDGVATSELFAGTEAGQATVTATAEGVSGTVQVTFTPLAPHQVTLEANPTTLPADGFSTTTITATVVDIHDNAVQDGTVVTFTTSLGAIVPVTATTTGGVATGTLTASITTGQATITATADGVSGTVQVAFTSLPPHQVTLGANPTNLPADGASTATLTATVVDVHDNTVEDGTMVTFTTSLGAIIPVTATTTGGVATGTLIAGTTAGQATVTAATGEASGTAQVMFTSLEPHQVTLEASSTTLPADGVSTAALTATVVDVHDNAVEDGTVVTFTTSLGTVAPVTATTTGGVATTTFTASLTPGSATVTATVGSQTGKVTIQISEICYLPLILRKEGD